MSPTLCEPLSHWETTNRTGNPSLSGVVFEGQFVLLLFCLRVRIVYRVCVFRSNVITDSGGR
jgi:hypothetical protein